MKAIIGAAKRDLIYQAKAKPLPNRDVKKLNCCLDFEPTHSLFFELTPAQQDLMDYLRRIAPSSCHVRTNGADWSHSNIRTATACLNDLGWIAEAEVGGISGLLGPAKIRSAFDRAARRLLK